MAVLLERGANVEHANVHGWTALHQAAYRGLPLLARMLLDAGAPVDVSARGDGGTPLIVALFWGNRDAAGLLAEHGIAPGNLRAAAGLGRLDLVDELVALDGRLAPDAGAHRVFYRPHGGFPAWRPSDDPQEVLDEALSWAARNDRADVLDVLVARGANSTSRSTAARRLRGRRRAAGCGRSSGCSRLARTRTGAFGGPQHGDGVTALHLAAQNDRLDAIELLLDAGADPTCRDGLYDSTPGGWAEEFGKTNAAALLRERAG